MKIIIEISDHPFYIGPFLEYNNILPDTLPFKMGIHPKYSIPRMFLDDEIKKVLSNLYNLGSFASTPLGESDLSTTRMDEFSETIISILGGDISNKKILEIGCGNGKLLYQFKKKGALVKGVEIGPQADVAKKTYGLDVINKPLSKKNLNEKFDCIFSYGCLEHIDDLESFFEESRSCLNNNGLFFHSVPNSKLSFKQFNLDHLLHQHINYFTPKNGVSLFNSQGFKDSSFSLTKNKNELMIWGFYDKKSTINWPFHIQELELSELKKYKIGLKEKSNKIRLKLDDIISRGFSIGFYAGGSEYGFDLKDKKGIRYFDSDEYKFGRKLLNGLSKIEPPKNLIKEKIDKIIVCKPHYFKVIYDSLVEIGVDPSTIISLNDLK